MPQPPTWNDSATIGLPLPSDGQAMGNYTETYAYDEVGNFKSIAHSAAAGGWSRTYAYDEPTTPPANNQLTSTIVSGTTERYTYDPNGNVVSMPHLSLMQWDWKNQLQATASQIVNDGSPETTHYLYDSLGAAGHQGHQQPERYPSSSARLPGSVRGLPRVRLDWGQRHPRTRQPSRHGRGVADLPVRDGHS